MMHHIAVVFHFRFPLNGLLGSQAQQEFMPQQCLSVKSSYSRAEYGSYWGNCPFMTLIFYLFYCLGYYVIIILYYIVFQLMLRNKALPSETFFLKSLAVNSEPSIVSCIHDCTLPMLKVVFKRLPKLTARQNEYLVMFGFFALVLWLKKLK